MAHHGMIAILPLYRMTSLAVGPLLLALTGSLLGCYGGERSEDTYQFIEYLEVAGECFEDHVKQPAPYTGSIVHWYNVTKDYHSRYGSVHHTRELDTEKFAERTKRPYKYYPPFTIQFNDLQQEDLKGDELRLAGVSTDYQEYKSTAVTVYMYESTCFLRVVRRLDHIPSTQEERSVGSRPTVIQQNNPGFSRWR
jgi:hypothetical protein